MPARRIESLKEIAPRIQRKLAVVTILSYMIFTLISTYPMIFSDFRLERY